VWLITGCSSGLGRALAVAVAGRGDLLLATARDPGTLAELVALAPDRVVPHRLDLIEPGAAQTAVDAAVRRFGRLDVLANYAGYALLGALEDIDEPALREQFETNLFGPLALTRAAVPIMRRRRSGTIVQMSSLAGVVPAPGGAAYVGSKAALEAVSECLAAEVAGFGIRVLIVEPGGFRTDAAGRSVRWAGPGRDYRPLIEPARAALESWHGRQPGDPALAAAAVLATLDEPDPPLRLPLGADAYEQIDTYLQRRHAEHHRTRIHDTAFTEQTR
jgi:NAD(P)-dependent dehydrogenase (short-subunit alcohol dehydrogenase family)